LPGRGSSVARIHVRSAADIGYDGAVRYTGGSHGSFTPAALDGERLASCWTEVSGVLVAHA